MKKWLTKLDQWAAEAIKAIRPNRHKTANVLTDNVHIKERNPSLTDEEGSEQERTVVIPDDTYLTREGQMIRMPIERKYRYRGRKRIKH